MGDKKEPRHDLDAVFRELDYERRMHRYWHRALSISMFFHGLISIPILISLIKIAATRLF